jgi:hypothetical protein
MGFLMRQRLENQDTYSIEALLCMLRKHVVGYAQLELLGNDPGRGRRISVRIPGSEAVYLQSSSFKANDLFPTFEPLHPFLPGNHCLSSFSIFLSR